MKYLSINNRVNDKYWITVLKLITFENDTCSIHQKTDYWNWIKGGTEEEMRTRCADCRFIVVTPFIIGSINHTLYQVDHSNGEAPTMFSSLMRCLSQIIDAELIKVLRDVTLDGPKWRQRVGLCFLIISVLVYFLKFSFWCWKQKKIWSIV